MEIFIGQPRFQAILAPQLVAAGVPNGAVPFEFRLISFVSFLAFTKHAREFASVAFFDLHEKFVCYCAFV